MRPWLSVLAVACCAASVSAGPLAFQQSRVSATSTTFAAIELAALDASPGLDVAAIHADGTLAIYSNDGLGGFGATPAVLASSAVAQPGALAIADVTGDGLPDIVCARSAPARVSVLAGRVGGGFSAPVDLASPAIVQRLALADLDGDGRLDMVVRYGSSDSIGAWMGDAPGHFAPGVVLRPGTYTLAFAIGDVDGDHHPDVVVSGLGPCSPTSCFAYSLYRGNGDGTFAPPVVVAQTLFVPGGIRLLDADGDARLDLVMLGVEGVTRFAVAFGDGAGGFGAAEITDFGASPSSSGDVGEKLVADADGDGAPDVLDVLRADLFTRASASVRVAHNDGHGHFAVSTRHAGVNWTGYNGYLAAARVADLDGDGILDILTATRGLSFLHGGPAGRFEVPQWATYPLGSAISSLREGTFSAMRLGPGLAPDLFVSQTGASPTVAGILRLANRGDGLFAEGTMWMPGEQLLAHFDTNADGMDDQVLTLNGANLESWINDGAGHLSLAQSFASDRPIAIADADGDGRADLWYRGADGVLSIRRGAPGGSFGAPVPTSVSLPAPGYGIGNVAALNTADLDGDGRADLCYARQLQVVAPMNRIYFLHNEGGLAFGAPDSLDGPEFPIPLAQHADTQYLTFLRDADVNGDGRRDLVLALSDGGMGGIGGVIALLRDSGGHYTPAPGCLVTSIFDLTTGDFDRDGRADVLVTRTSGNGDDYAFVLRSQGDGSFTPDLSESVYDYGGNVAIADFDGDGMPDFAVVSTRHAQVLIHRNALPPVGPTAVESSLLAANVIDGRAELQWRVAGASGIPMTVERTRDGVAWSEIGNVQPGVDGLVTFIDAGVLPGARYGWRLAWVENALRATSDPAWLTLPGGAVFALRSLGSARGAVALELSMPAAGGARVELFDVAGRRVASARPGVASPGTQRVVLGEHLAQGLYLARAEAAGVRASAKVLVLE